MITAEYCRTMARYNAWQNASLYAAADGIGEAAREADRGAFWGSIRRTLSHLYWGDLIWIARFDGGDGPDASLSASHDAYDWAMLWESRPKLDARIAAWAWSVEPQALTGDVTWYSYGAGREMSKPMDLCVMQLFNHQTHHRGQVHAMLTAADAKPDDTDLPFLPDDLDDWPAAASRDDTDTTRRPAQ